MSRILIAEDRPASRELLRTVLESSGYDVIEASNGGEALEKAAADGIDLFLLDLQMPVLDGFGVLEELRQNPDYRSTPVVAVTASAMHGDRERAMRAGFSAYIAKPLDLGALRSEVRRLLTKS